MARGGGQAGGEDWDLNLEDGEGVEYMPGREDLPVLVTLNLVRGGVSSIRLEADGSCRSRGQT